MYGLFISLRDKGLIVETGSSRIGSGRPKRLYTTTILGLAAVRLYRDILAWQDARHLALNENTISAQVSRL